MTKAYHEACAEGSTIINRARLNLVRHDGAGKTSFFNRLMGEEMKIDEQSTEAIATHLIKSSFNKSDLMQAADWNEIFLDTEDILKYFNDQVLLKAEITSAKSDIDNMLVKGQQFEEKYDRGQDKEQVL